MIQKIPTTALMNELWARQKTRSRLVRSRARLQAKIETIDAQLQTLTGKRWSAAGTRTRPKNDGPLVEHLKTLLRRQTMSVSEATDAVQKAGYQTSSPNFRTIVNQTLLRPEFKRVGRGQYTTK